MPRPFVRHQQTVFEHHLKASHVVDVFQGVPPHHDEVSDLAHFHENYESNGVPNFNSDRAQTLASLDRFKKIAGNLKATVIIQHDARDVSKLPAFPASAK